MILKVFQKPFCECGFAIEVVKLESPNANRPPKTRSGAECGALLSPDVREVRLSAS